MHVDMDAFYASVEQRDHPEWRGKPVIVGGKGKRSVAATASYEARAYGVHSAMSISEAKHRCPDGIFVEPRFEVYHAISDEIHAIMLHYAEAIEPIAWMRHLWTFQVWEVNTEHWEPLEGRLRRKSGRKPVW